MTRLLTIAELAEHLRVSKRTAYRVAREMINAEIGGRLVVPEAAVERYIEAKMRQPTWETCTDAVRSGTPITTTAAANDDSAPPRPRTSRSRAHGSETSSWLQRPIAPRTRPKRSTQR